MNISGVIESEVVLVKDFPCEGVLFRDYSNLFLDTGYLKVILRRMLVEKYGEIPGRFVGASCVLGIESRGFLISSPLSEIVNGINVIVRKKGKLPPPVVSTKPYDKEYGKGDILEISERNLEVIRNGVVIIADDVIATGGTIVSLLDMVRDYSPSEVIVMAIASIDDLGGYQRISEELAKFNNSQIIVGSRIGGDRFLD